MARRAGPTSFLFAPRLCWRQSHQRTNQSVWRRTPLQISLSNEKGAQAKFGSKSQRSKLCHNLLFKEEEWVNHVIIGYSQGFCLVLEHGQAGGKGHKSEKEHDFGVIVTATQRLPLFDLSSAVLEDFYIWAANTLLIQKMESRY